MRKASFSVNRRDEFTDIHTQRLNGHNSAIFENSNYNSYKSFYDYDNFLELAKQKYEQTVKQKKLNKIFTQQTNKNQITKHKTKQTI